MGSLQEQCSWLSEARKTDPSNARNRILYNTDEPDVDFPQTLHVWPVRSWIENQLSLAILLTNPGTNKWVLCWAAESVAFCHSRKRKYRGRGKRPRQSEKGSAGSHDYFSFENLAEGNPPEDYRANSGRMALRGSTEAVVLKKEENRKTTEPKIWFLSQSRR